MKPIYKSVNLTRDTLEASLKLQAEVYNNGATATQDVPAESLEGLRVQLVSPNVSGARDLIASGECTIDGATLNVEINASGLIQGTHRLVVKMEYGTQTVVLYGLDITVPATFEEGDAQEFEDIITVVSTFGDGDMSGADATVYAKDEDGNAHITKPLSIGGGVATGDCAIASGIADAGASIQATSDGAIASGHADAGASIQATSYGAIASGIAYGDGASIQADGNGAIASGYADAGASIQATSDGAIASGHAYGDGASIQATSEGAIASGIAYGDGASIQADGNGAIASGYADATHGNVSASGMASQAFGMGTQTRTNAQMVIGKCNVLDTNGDYALIVGNGVDDQNRSNAFAIDWNGNLVLFNAGTPVVLTPAKLATLIA